MFVCVHVYVYTYVINEMLMFTRFAELLGKWIMEIIWTSSPASWTRILA